MNDKDIEVLAAKAIHSEVDDIEASAALRDRVLSTSSTSSNHSRRIVLLPTAAIAAVLIVVFGTVGVITLGGESNKSVKTASQPSTTNASLPDNVRGRPAPTPIQCPTNQSEPSMSTGSFCGPTPTEGNGNGSKGICTGSETTAPCASGAVVGQYYDFTLPVSCSGLVVFNGQKWVLSLKPPNNGPSMDVWMRLDSQTSASFISPEGSESLVPYDGSPLRTC